MVRSICEGIPGPTGTAFFSGSFKLSQKRGGLHMSRTLIDHDLPGREIDLEGRPVMDTSQVSHEHAVDKDPHIVIAAEFISHGSFLCVVCKSSVLLYKPGGHRQAEIMLYSRVF